MALIHQCCACNQLIGPCPVPEKQFLVTSCFHIFHQECLKDWVTVPVKTCPLCMNNCYQRQAGKDFQIIWKIFLIALEHMSEPTLEALGTSEYINGQCCICTDNHPPIPLFFDPEQKRLFHDSCALPDNAVRLTADDIVAAVKKCAEKDAKLKEILTPSPPSSFETLSPYASQVMVTIRNVAALALPFLPFLNR